MIASSLVACGNLNGQTEEISGNNEVEAGTEPITEEKELTETESEYQKAYNTFVKLGVTNPAMVESNMINWGLDDPELIQQMFADLGIETAEEDEEEANEELNIAQVPQYWLFKEDLRMQYYYENGRQLISEGTKSFEGCLLYYLGTDESGFDYFFFDESNPEDGKYFIFKNAREVGHKKYGKQGYCVSIYSPSFDNFKGVDYKDIVRNGEPEEWGVVFDALHGYYLELEANGELQEFETYVFD